MDVKIASLVSTSYKIKEVVHVSEPSEYLKITQVSSDMSGVEMKNTGEAHTYPAAPPPYTPPQPTYDPGQPGPATVIHPGTTTVIHSSIPMGRPGVSAIVVTNQMSPSPTGFVCRSCNQQIVTRVEYKPSLRTHLFALLLCVVGCWPCVCVPYCMDTCNNADHYCPNCNAYVGSYFS